MGRDASPLAGARVVSAVPAGPAVQWGLERLLGVVALRPRRRGWQRGAGAPGAPRLGRLLHSKPTGGVGPVQLVERRRGVRDPPRRPVFNADDSQRARCGARNRRRKQPEVGAGRRCVAVGDDPRRQFVRPRRRPDQGAHLQEDRGRRRRPQPGGVVRDAARHGGAHDGPGRKSNRRARVGARDEQSVQHHAVLSGAALRAGRPGPVARRDEFARPKGSAADKERKRDAASGARGPGRRPQHARLPDEVQRPGGPHRPVHVSAGDNRPHQPDERRRPRLLGPAVSLQAEPVSQAVPAGRRVRRGGQAADAARRHAGAGRRPRGGVAAALAGGPAAVAVARARAGWGV